MPINVIMPQMGESIFEGTVTKWLKKLGDRVERDEPLFEISTDKVDAEIPSPAAGVLSKVLVPEGQTVQINTVVAVLEGAGEAAAAPQPPAEAAKPAAPPPPPPVAPPALRAAVVEMPSPPSAGERIRSSPLVRKLSKEYNIDISRVPGTGSGGRVSKQDTLAYVAAQRGGAAPSPAAPSPAPAAMPRPEFAGRVEVVPMTPMRAKISERMVLSRRTSAHVHTVFQVDLTRVARLREQYRARFEQQEGVKLTYTPFFLHAAALALKAFPIVNASVDATNIVYKKDINIGVAVALDWGLIVPVIHHAEEKNFLGLARAVVDLAERARNKKLSPDEVQNGTFTVTNPGLYGALFGTPIIMQPQVAILGIGQIHKAPVVIDDAIAIRSIAYLTLGYDHRLVDGAVADQFMSHIKKTLETWEEALL